ncbi:hypothetical protein [Litoreibacter albidus]|uniref:hypothetical protein n=1 Tax=Litoreibacter albidus TaxID=670155 RepID=UPI0011148D8A|nr:hypothetical protein [Litoreibacter albidus]
MDEKLKKSLDTILANAARHCVRFRLVDHDFTAIPSSDLRRLASSMLDYFEEEMEGLRGNVGGTFEGSVPSGTGAEGAPPLGVNRSTRGHWR